MKKAVVLFVVLAMVCMVGGMAYADLNDGLEAYWNFDEVQGDDVFDQSGNGNDGTNNGATRVDGICGRALDFDGLSNYYVEVPFSTSSTSTFTFAVWIYPRDESPQYELIFDRESHFVIEYRDVAPAVGNKICQYTYQGGDFVCSDTVLRVNEWNFVTFVRRQEQNTALVYLNGNPDGSGISYPRDLNGTYFIGGGGRPSGINYPFDGMIDEFRIYNRELSAEEIQVLYAEGLNCLVPPVTCVGFEPPMAAGPVKVKKNRALPHKAQLLDSEGFPVTDADIAAPPVIQVLYDSGTGGDPVDVTDDALPAGEGTEGNQFVYTEDEKWQFNLKTKNYTASGTYIVTMVSGDDSEYQIDPTCESSFVIE